jgi:hypothetical protein
MKWKGTLIKPIKNLEGAKAKIRHRQGLSGPLTKT